MVVLGNLLFQRFMLRIRRGLFLFYIRILTLFSIMNPFAILNTITLLKVLIVKYEYINLFKYLVSCFLLYIIKTLF